MGSDDVMEQGTVQEPAQATDAARTGSEQETRPSVQRHKGGAPKGNLNGMKHGLYRAKQKRDRFRKRGEDEARRILKASGLQNDPLATLTCRQIGRLESMISRMEDHHQRRGHFRVGGELKASVRAQLDTVGSLLDRAQRLFQALQERETTGKPQVMEFRIVYQDDPRTGPPPDDPDLLPSFTPLPPLGPLEDPGMVVEAAAEPVNITPEPPKPEPKPAAPSEDPHNLGWLRVFGGGTDD